LKTKNLLYVGLVSVMLGFSACQPCDVPFLNDYLGGPCDCDCPDDPEPPIDSTLFIQPAIQDVLLGDFDGDGRADVHTTAKDAATAGWFISYAGTSPWLWTSKNMEHASQLVVGNFDYDNTSDIALPGSGYDNTRSWMVSYSAKTEWQQLNTSYAAKGMILLGDFNADGLDDIFYPVDGFNGVGWYVIYGGTNQWVMISNSAATVDQLILGDFDGNGYADVLTSTPNGWAGAGCYIKYNYTGEWMNNPGEWEKLNDRVFEMKSLKVGDFDGDGKDDLLALNMSANQMPSMLISYGATSDWKDIPMNGGYAYDVMIGDFDGDGRDDIFSIPERSADGAYHWVVYYGGRFAPEKLR